MFDPASEPGDPGIQVTENSIQTGFKQSGNLLAHVIKEDRDSIKMGSGSRIH